MELSERIVRYKAIEEYRDRPLIVYATSTRFGCQAKMAGDAVREFIDQIHQITDGKQVDILLHSTGGDALTAWKLMSILRERFDKVTVLVPFMAFSAATIFAMGADEIVMHPHASLGPIDPQITVNSPQGSRSFAFEDVGAFLRFLADEVRITEQPHSTAVVKQLFEVVDPLIVGAAKRASELSSSVGERLLRMHMRGADGEQKARQLAQNLNKSFFAHGDAVSRSRARDLKLKIATDDEKLEGLLWDAFVGIESWMELRVPFQPFDVLMKDPSAAAELKPSAPLVLPANTPPNVAQQLWQQAAQQALQNLQGPGIDVAFQLVNAVIESPRLASENRTEGTLSACRKVGGDITVARTDIRAVWRNVPIP